MLHKILKMLTYSLIRTSRKVYRHHPRIGEIGHDAVFSKYLLYVAAAFREELRKYATVLLSNLQEAFLMKESF